MHKVRLAVIAAGTATALGLLSALAGPAAATTELSRAPQASGPFKLGPASSPGSVVLTSTGSRVAVFDISSGLGKTKVCLIAPTGRACSHSTLLSPPAGDNTYGRPGVFAPSAGHVVVLQRTCCDAIDSNSTVLYRSADGGKTFTAPTRVSSLGVDASELIGGQILVTEMNDSSGLQVASIPISASGASPTATISARVAFDVAVGQYKGSALVAADNNGGPYITTVYHAAKGSSFGAASSYHSVAKLSGESLIAMSGAALLTDRTSTDTVLLRMFNGTGFGPAHAVAHIHGGLGTWITVDQDPGGHVHVFAVLGSAGYHMLEVSTSTGGKSWSSAANLGYAISSTWLSAAVNSKGRGLVLGTMPAWGYPVP